MKRTSFAALLTSTSLLALAGTAAAQPGTAAADQPPAVATAAPAPEARNSINVSPLSFLIGFNVNYERTVAPGHGAMVELGGAAVSLGEEADIDMRGLSLGVGYRYHWNRRQHGGFVGAMLQHDSGTAEVETGTTMSDVDFRATSLIGNIGYRWMLGEHVNITLRIGAGVAAKSVSGDDAMAVEKVRDAYVTRGALDGELSVGFNF